MVCYSLLFESLPQPGNVTEHPISPHIRNTVFKQVADNTAVPQSIIDQLETSPIVRLMYPVADAVRNGTGRLTLRCVHPSHNKEV